MIKCRIHIENDECYMDPKVFKEILLPCLPHIGDWIYVDKEELTQKARASLDIARSYADWFYGHSCDIRSGERELTNKDLGNLSFEDAGVVCSIRFEENSEIVDIEINNS